MLNVPMKAAATWALGARELFYYPPINDPVVPFRRYEPSMWKQVWRENSH
jgi:hypothetical protein